MKFLEGLGIAGKAILSAQGPLGVIAVSAINKFLPDDEKIKEEDTVEVFDSKLDSLSSTDKALVVQAYYREVTVRALSADKVTINSSDNITEQLRIMEASDVRIHTRPDIAVLMSKLVVIVIGVVVIGHVCVSVYNHTVIDIKMIMGLLALPTWVIVTYFNLRTDDKTATLNALTGGSYSPPKSLMKTVVEKLKK